MRAPAVAGSFYTSNSRELAREVDDYISKASRELANVKKPFALVAPHAGYMYSGAVAGFSYACLKKAYSSPPPLVILSPNHTGNGVSLALSREDWKTPLGVAKNDEELARKIEEAGGNAIEFDENGHEFEHSLEVQLPFLQRVYREFKFVGICMLEQSFESASAVANAVYEASKGKAVVIASSDFTHFENAESAKRKDFEAIEKLKSLDARGFVEVVRARRASICGFAPIAAAALYAKKCGASEGKLLKYASSGDVTGDRSSVVAYASLSFE
ncbi:MAG: AmmeMemoRadiSam system protein B [Candidatus Micrarchaeota archaeon]